MSLFVICRSDPKGCNDIGHLGEGAGTFVGDPNLENLRGLVHDIGTTGVVLSGGAIPGGEEVLGLPVAIRWITEAIDYSTTIYDTGSAVGETASSLANGDSP